MIHQTLDKTSARTHQCKPLLLIIHPCKNDTIVVCHQSIMVDTQSKSATQCTTHTQYDNYYLSHTRLNSFIYMWHVSYHLKYQNHQILYIFFLQYDTALTWAIGENNQITVDLWAVGYTALHYFYYSSYGTCLS